MAIIETARLSLRELSLEDAEFILRLLNEPSFVQNIGDRGVRTLEDARVYIINGPMASYQKGYAFEAAMGVLSYARNHLGLKRLLAAANADNLNSIRLLEKIGFRFERMTRLMEGEPEVKLFAFAVDG